jgi:hypothetical protein
MNRTMLLLLLVAAVAAWTVETTNRERLTKRIDVMRANTRALGRVQAEHERLLRIQPFVGEIDSLRRDRAEVLNLRRELVNRQTGSGPYAQRVQAALGREVLPSALWLPTRQMKDLGRTTPHALLQTAFWAAASGQTPALRDLLAFEPAVRARAEAILISLPESKRAGVGSPELLVANALRKITPPEAIQVLAEQFKGFDEAVEYLALRTVAGDEKVVALQLRWAPGGWRLLVPLEVVENAGRELRGEGMVVRAE